MKFLEGDIVVYRRMHSVYWAPATPPSHAIEGKLSGKSTYMPSEMNDKVCEIVKILNSMYFIVPIPHRVEEGFDLEKGYWVTIDSIFLHVELTRDNRIDKIFGI